MNQAEECCVGGFAGGEEGDFGALVVAEIEGEDGAAAEVGEEPAGLEDDGGEAG